MKFGSFVHCLAGELLRSARAMERELNMAARHLAERLLDQHGERAVGHLVRAITAAVRAGDDAEVALLDLALQRIELVLAPADSHWRAAKVAS